MNINGIPGGLPTPPAIAESGRARVEQQRSERPDLANSAPQPQQSGSAAASSLGTARPPASLPATAPPGTDPELWSVLSAEERVFFAKVGAMGPLTYGRLASEAQAQPPVARGGRLNVRG